MNKYLVQFYFKYFYPELRLIIKTTNNQYVSFDLITFDWHTVASYGRATTINYLKPHAPAKAVLAALQTDYRQRQISQLRLLQDLHSGRILRIPGTLVNDIAAILLMLLALSGLIVWKKR